LAFYKFYFGKLFNIIKNYSMDFKYNLKLL